MNQPAQVDWKQFWAKASNLDLQDITEIDVSNYTSAEHYKVEQEKIFRRSWIIVGRASEIPEQGDFIKKAIYPLDTEALIVRDRDGQINAFYNACRHRGAAIVNESCGKTKLFRCPYHAWSYGTDGLLKGLPNPDDFCQVTRNETSLKRIHVDTWKGFLFLNFSEQPEQTLLEFLGDFAPLYDDAPFEDYTHAVEITQDLPTNWKNFMDAFNEGYHVQYIHKNTLDMVPCKKNPLNNFYDPVFCAPHSGFTVQTNPEWLPKGPVQVFVYSTDGGTMIRQSAGGAEAGPTTGPRLFTSASAVNRCKLPNFGVEVANVFPLSQFQILADRYMWFQFWPMGPGKTRFITRMYFSAKPRTYRQAFAEAHLLASTRDIVTEDLSMTELQQRGQTSGGIDKMYPGENEPMLRYVNKVLNSYLNR